MQGHRDVSVNRCPTKEEGEDEIFMYTNFKLGKKTPHGANDCTGAHFTIEESVLDIIERSEPCCSDAPDISIPSACSVIPNVYQLHNIDTEAIVEQRDCQLDIARMEKVISELNSEEMECVCITQNVSLPDDSEIEELESRIIRMSNSTATPGEPVCKIQRLTNYQDVSTSSIEGQQLPLKPWEDHSHFKNQWLQQIKKYQSRFVASTLLTNENKVWIEYLFSENDPKKSTFRCRFCHSYLQTHPETKNVPLLARTPGYFVEDYLRMWKQISLHTSASVHKKAILSIKEVHTKFLKDCSHELKEKVLLQISNEHLPTIKMIRTVYAEIKLNLPFSAHFSMVQLQKLNGVDLGKHHFEKTSATRITENISKKMHDSFLTHLKKRQFPMSIILDTSSDSANKNYLLIYIRTIEENYPITYFYRCLYVPTETSEYLFNKLVAAFDEDKLLQTFKDHLYGFASDGAPVMLGTTGGLAKRIHDITRINFYTIHCLAHKLQLAIGHALQSVDNNLKQKLENLVNGIYSFYYDKSFKRKQSLVETAEAFGQTFSELHYVHPIRWISSEFIAFESMYKLYPIIIQNMQLIMDSNEFNDDVSARAKGYKTTLLQTNFLTTFLFVIDLLKLLGDVSLKFQKSDSTLIGKETLRLELFKAIEDLKEKNGPHLTFFLQHATCKKNNIWMLCTLNDLNDCEVKFTMNGRQLTLSNKIVRRDNAGWAALSTLRLRVVDAVLFEIQKYFPEGSFQMFEVLNPSKLPTMTKNVPKYITGITNLAARFGFGTSVIQKQFSKLLITMITDHHEMYCSLNKKDPVTFWAYFLKNKMITWDDDMKKLLYIVLALPIGSADVERGFSTKNHFKTNWRSTLTTSHIEDIMRIRINGPELENFDSLTYTLHWLNTKHLDSDDPISGRGSIEKKENNGKSNLF